MVFRKLDAFCEQAHDQLFLLRNKNGSTDLRESTRSDI